MFSSLRKGIGGHEQEFTSLETDWQVISLHEVGE
jgi:hypothetical protein